MEDHRGMLWIGKAEEGIYLFDKKRKTSKNILIISPIRR